MADDIARPGEDPRDVARERVREGRGRRARATAIADPNLDPRKRAALLGPGEAGNAEMARGRAQAAATNLPTVRRENLPAVRNENLPAVRNENMPTVRRENLPAVQSGGANGGGGGGGGGRAVVPSGGDRPPVSGGGSSRALATVDNRIPLNLGNAASTAANVGGRLLTRGLGAAGIALDSSPAGRGSSLTSNPDSQRFLDEDAARRAPRRADADMENPAPSVSMVAAEAAARNQRRAATRPNTRMSPRELTPDELHNIQSLTLDPESGIAEMRGVRGEAARNIIARRAELEREPSEGMKRGGPVKKMAKGGVVKSSASGRSDGCAVKGKTKGRMV